MMYRQKSMNYRPSRVTVFFSGTVIAAFGVAKRRKKDAAASICYVSIRNYKERHLSEITESFRYRKDL